MVAPLAARRARAIKAARMAVIIAPYQRLERGQTAHNHGTQALSCTTQRVLTDQCNSGGGTMTRERTITQALKPGCPCNACPSLVENAPCNTEPCSADCKVTEWSPWSGCGGCNKLNGVGYRIRQRLKSADMTGDGAKYVHLCASSNVLKIVI
jgi:hypothetical protein